MVHVSRGEREAGRLTDDLAGAVDELRTCLEPTPSQLAESYRRVRKVLSSVPGAAVPFDRSSSDAGATSPFVKNARAKRVGLRRRCARWLASSGAVASLGVAAAIGRWTATNDAVPDTRLQATVLRPAEASATTDIAGGRPSPIGAGGEHEVIRAEVVPVAPPRSTLDLPIPPPSVPNHRSRSTPRGCSLERDALLRAECQLRSGQPSGALGSLRHVPKEAPSELVAAIELLASCQLGRDVRALAARFLEAWPASPLGERIRNECPNALPAPRRIVAGTAPRVRSARVE